MVAQNMFLCLCLCVCVCVCLCVCVFVCVCMCVCVTTNILLLKHVFLCVSVSLCMCGVVCVCVFACVCICVCFRQLRKKCLRVLDSVFFWSHTQVEWQKDGSVIHTAQTMRAWHTTDQMRVWDATQKTDVCLFFFKDTQLKSRWCPKRWSCDVVI